MRLHLRDQGSCDDNTGFLTPGFGSGHLWGYWHIQYRFLWNLSWFNKTNSLDSFLVHSVFRVCHPLMVWEWLVSSYHVFHPLEKNTVLEILSCLAVEGDSAVTCFCLWYSMRLSRAGVNCPRESSVLLLYKGILTSTFFCPSQLATLQAQEGHRWKGGADWIGKTAIWMCVIRNLSQMGSSSTSWCSCAKIIPFPPKLEWLPTNQ